MAETYYDRVLQAAEAIRRRVPEEPRVGVVLGSGLGDFARAPRRPVEVPYADLPNWPVSGIAGHEGRLVVGEVRGLTVAVLSGRCHLYEGHGVQAVTFAARAMGLLGVRTLILTNAAGGVATRLEAGALMVIDDHLNLTGSSPLAGPNDDRFGPRFPDMSQVYSSRLRGIADRAGAGLGMALPHGVYAALPGPSYETPAEIRYLRTIGADAVGMSTVPEAIVARHMGIEVLGISCITNMAAGVLPQPLDHAEVIQAARRVRGPFSSLLEAIIGQL
jgi:purine-nucleoside phosphorylase